MPTFLVNGIKIYYEDLGNKESENCIAFFNGAMSTTNSWELLYPVFVHMGWRVILHDFKGQLKSDKPEGPYTFATIAGEAKALLDYLDVKRVHVVGTSYGGRVAMEFAHAYPEMMASLSVVNSFSEINSLIKTLVRSWEPLRAALDGEHLFWNMIPIFYGDDFLTQNYEAVAGRAKLMRELTADDFRGQKAIYDTILTDAYMTNRLHEIKCPTLIVCSDQDILTTVKFSQSIAEHIPHSEFLIIPGCGHVTIAEKPEELKSAVLGFTMKHSF